jgi:hypothetical protein
MLTTCYAVVALPENLPANEIIQRLETAVDRNNQILTTARRVRQQRWVRCLQ